MELVDLIVSKVKPAFKHRVDHQDGGYLLFPWHEVTRRSPSQAYPPTPPPALNLLVSVYRVLHRIFEVKMRDCKRAGEAGSWLFSWPDESITDLLCRRQDVKSQLKS